MGRLDDKVCVITGGARGQGAAEAARFVGEGATVYITDVRVEAGEKTAADTGATFVEHDVADAEQWEALVRRVVDDCGRLDVLVNNAGRFRPVPSVETSLELWDRTVAVNQTGVFLGIRAVAPQMQAQGGGSIVNISSIAGLRANRAFAYSATKWAVRGMTKCAALELGPYGIRVNSVHPGIIDTEMIAGLALDKAAETVPLRRIGSAGDVADLVLWLASDESSFVSGAEVAIDGAMTV